MQRMNCWQTTWGATLSNVGSTLTALMLGEGTGISPIHFNLTKETLGLLFVVGLICKTVGTQWQGIASADNREVKRHLNLNPDGTQNDGGPLDKPESKNQLKLPIE